MNHETFATSDAAHPRSRRLRRLHRALLGGLVLGGLAISGCADSSKIDEPAKADIETPTSDTVQPKPPAASGTTTASTPSPESVPRPPSPPSMPKPPASPPFLPNPPK